MLCTIITATTGKIIGIQFENAAMVLDEEYIDNGFQEDVALGPGNQLFYSIVPEKVDNPNYLPYEVRHGTYNDQTKTITPVHTITNTTWHGLQITDPNKEGIEFTGLYGIGFSPSSRNNNDPRTQHGYMVGTAPYGFWQVGLQETAGKYNPVKADTKLLCSLPEWKYPGGMGFIPSGSKKDGVMLADFDSGTVQILPLDYDTPASDGTKGLCLNNSTKNPELGTNNPYLVNFATNVTDAWGFMFDPQVGSSRWSSMQCWWFLGYVNMCL